MLFMNYKEKAYAVNGISVKIQAKALLIQNNENHIARMDKQNDEFNSIKAYIGADDPAKTGIKGPYDVAVKNSHLRRALLDANEDLKAEIRALECELEELLKQPAKD